MKLVVPRRYALMLWTVVLFEPLCCQQREGTRHTRQAISCEEFGTQVDAPLLILLHGASGPGKFYTQQAEFFAKHGFRVVLPHYFEASHGAEATDEHYEAWIRAIDQVMRAHTVSESESSTVMIGYSLGASVALALGSQGKGPKAIAELSGSLPDKYYRDLVDMPPLLILHGGRDTNVPVAQALQLAKLCSIASLSCEIKTYPAEGHTFSPKNLLDADQVVLQFSLKALHMEHIAKK